MWPPSIPTYTRDSALWKDSSTSPSNVHSTDYHHSDLTHQKLLLFLFYILPFLSFIEPIFSGNILLVSLIFLKRLLDFKKRWQEELYKKDLHDADNHDAVTTHLEPDILDYEVKWALGSTLQTKLV